MVSGSLRREVLRNAIAREAVAHALQVAEREAYAVRGARRQLDRTAGTLSKRGARLLPSRLAEEGPADPAEHLVEQRGLGWLSRGARGRRARNAQKRGVENNQEEPELTQLP